MSLDNFVSPAPWGSYSLPESSLHVVSGRSWVAKGISLQFQSGYGLLVDGSLHGVGCTFLGPEGGGSGSGTTTRFDDVQITFGSGGRLLVGTSSSTFGSGWTGLKIDAGATASIEDSELYLPTTGTLSTINGALAILRSTLAANGSYWSGLLLQGGSHVTLDEVDIGGVYVSASGATLSVGTGSNGSFTLKNSEVSSAGSGAAAVYVHSASTSVNVYGNIIDASTGDGIRSNSYTTTRAWGNDINMWTAGGPYSGFYAMSLAALYGGRSGYSDGGNRVLDTSNEKNRALYASGSSALLMAGYTTAEDDPVWGDNVFCGTRPVLVETASGGTIFAEVDDWPDGVATGRYSGTVTVSHVGTADCGGARSVLDPVGRAESPAIHALEPADDPDRAALRLAFGSLASGEFDDAAERFAALAASSIQGDVVADALRGVGRTILESRRPLGLQHLEKFDAWSTDLERARAEALMMSYAALDQLEASKAEAAMLMRTYPESGEALRAGLLMAEWARDAGDFASAATLLGDAGAMPSLSEGDGMSLDSAWWLLGEYARHAGTSITGAPLTEPAESSQVAGASSDIQIGAHPNPFNPATVISFDLSDETLAEIDVYDTLGRHVERLAGGVFQAGRHILPWDTSRRAGGSYFVVIRAGGAMKSIPVILLK